MRKSSVPRAFVLFALVSSTAFSQPSFDCAKADSTVEKTMCADASLASLDMELAQVYRRTVAAAGTDQFLIRAEERHWLAALADECDHSNAAECIRRAIQKRIPELESEAASPAKGTTVYLLNQVSHRFDFTFRIRAHIPDDMDGYREGPAKLLVSKKGGAVPFQTIMFEKVFAILGKDGKPLANTAELYDDQGLINVGDFNFDGYEDFAVQTGNDGSYGGPSYSVYLYVPSEEKFHPSAPLSKLTVEGLGFFDIDAKHKHLIVLSKSGCCYHERTQYSIKQNLPVPDSRDIEDGTKDPNYLLISHQRYVNGKWLGTTKRVRQDDQKPN
jgi:uncharacterized protein YecT (DUF1311 family)